MSSRPEVLKLSRNHRRVLSVVLRNLERTCDGVTEWVEKGSGILQEVVDDLSASQKERLRTLSEDLRGEVRRLDSQITLDHSQQSRRAALVALLSAAIVELEDSDSARLVGYGALAPATQTRIDSELARLIAALDEMLRIVSTG